MKRKIWIICSVAVCIILAAVGILNYQAGKQTENEQCKIYFINSAETGLQEKVYVPEKETADFMLKDLVEQFDNEENGFLPDGVKIDSFSTEDSLLRLVFNSGYSDMAATSELLVRAGVVKTFLQVPDVLSVEFYIGEKPLTDFKGQEIGAMTESTFVEFSGSDSDAYNYATFTLYFTNKKGDRLVEESRTVRYRRNIPREKVALEQLARGPLEKGHYPTLPENSRILSLSTEDGVSYVDFNSVFLDYALDIQEQIPVYSVVNTLLGVTGAKQVEISVEGEKEVTFGKNMQLYNFYEWNENLIEKK